MNANNRQVANTQVANTQAVNTLASNTPASNTQKTNNKLYTKDNIIKPRVLFKLLSNVSASFNLLSRIIILAVSIIIIEKFIEKKILTIKIATEGKTEAELQKELLVNLIKELWYIPFVILFYNLIVVAIIYVAYSFIWLILKKPAGQGEPPQQSSQSKTYLYNVKIFQELLYSPLLLLIVNLMIIVLIYVIFILLSKNTLSNRDGLKDEILKNFLSYYKYCNYMFLVFMFIIFEGIDMVDIWNTTKEQTMQQPAQKTE